MGKMQRDKGARAERELGEMLAERLGIKVARNLAQPREGGADLPVPGWAIEVKRQEAVALAKWWEQAVIQAQQAGARPALAYRQSRRPWRVIVWLPDLSAHFAGASNGLDMTTEMGVDAFCKLVREMMP